MDAALGEVNTTDNLAGKYFCPFLLLGILPGEDNDHSLFAEVLLSPTLASRCRDGVLIYVRIPYVADSRELKVRLRTDDGNGQPDYRLNPENNRLWYTAVRDEAGSCVPVKMSEIRRYNAESNYALVLQGGTLALYSASETDMMIRPALRQNEMFLLKASAGNLYQYPITGVGLIDFLHGNFENSGLAAKLQSEFENDRMTINEAYMNSETGELLLDVTEKNE